MNFGSLPGVNDITRLQSRSLDDPEFVVRLQQRLQESHPYILLAAEALEQRLVTFAPDDIDWDDEIRLCLEERASFSPDALTGMEANLRFAGPETMESKIFARLTAWQNWIFQRPNATGENGALKSYGTGNRSQYDKARV
jgi:benzoyl-CoA-dihydrodiol lyase